MTDKPCVILINLPDYINTIIDIQNELKVATVLSDVINHKFLSGAMGVSYITVDRLGNKYVDNTKFTESYKANYYPQNDELKRNKNKETAELERQKRSEKAWNYELKLREIGKGNIKCNKVEYILYSEASEINVNDMLTYEIISEDEMGDKIRHNIETSKKGKQLDVYSMDTTTLLSAIQNAEKGSPLNPLGIKQYIVYNINEPKYNQILESLHNKRVFKVNKKHITEKYDIDMLSEDAMTEINWDDFSNILYYIRSADYSDLLQISKGYTAAKAKPYMGSLHGGIMDAQKKEIDYKKRITNIKTLLKNTSITQEEKQKLTQELNMLKRGLSNVFTISSARLQLKFPPKNKNGTRPGKYIEPLPEAIGEYETCYILISKEQFDKMVEPNFDIASYIEARLTQTQKTCQYNPIYIVYTEHNATKTQVNNTKKTMQSKIATLKKKVSRLVFSKTKKTNSIETPALSLFESVNMFESLPVSYAIEFPNEYNINTLTVDSISGNSNRSSLLTTLQTGQNVIKLPETPVKDIKIQHKKERENALRVMRQGMSNNMVKSITKVKGALFEFNTSFIKITKIIELIGTNAVPFTGDTTVDELKTRCNMIARNTAHKNNIENANQTFITLYNQLAKSPPGIDYPKESNDLNNPVVVLRDSIYAYLTTVLDICCKFVDILLIVRNLQNYLYKYYNFEYIYKDLSDTDKTLISYTEGVNRDSYVIVTILTYFLKLPLQIKELLSSNVFETGTLESIYKTATNMGSYINNFGFLHIPSSEYLLFLDETDYKQGYCPNMFYGDKLNFNAALDNPYRFNMRMRLMIYLIDMHKAEYNDTETLSRYMDTVAGLIERQTPFKPDDSNPACVNKQLYTPFSNYLKTQIIDMIDLLLASHKNNRTLARKNNKVYANLAYIYKHIPKLFDAPPTADNIKQVERALANINNVNSLNYNSLYDLYNLLRKLIYRIYVYNTHINANNINTRMSNTQQLYFSYTFDDNKEIKTNNAHAASVEAEKAKPVQIKSQEISGPRAAFVLPEKLEAETPTNNLPKLPIVGATTNESPTEFQQVPGAITEESSTNTTTEDYNPRASWATISTTSRTASTGSRRPSAGNNVAGSSRPSAGNNVAGSSRPSAGNNVAGSRSSAGNNVARSRRSSAGSSRSSSISSIISNRSRKGSTNSGSSGYGSANNSRLKVVKTRKGNNRKFMLEGVEAGESSPDTITAKEITAKERIVADLLNQTDFAGKADLRQYLLSDKVNEYSTTLANKETLLAKMPVIKEKNSVSKRKAIFEIRDKINKITESGRQINISRNLPKQSIAA